LELRAKTKKQKTKTKAQPKPGGTLKKKSGQTLGQIKNKSPAEARRHS
jgi:hypothetical protein